MTPRTTGSFSGPVLVLLAAPILFTGCTNPIDSELEAELAYLGLDGAVRKAVQLGFDGFNEADSANIPPQQTVGEVSGTLLVLGQVDQGASANKGMRLTLTLDEYSDLGDLDAGEGPEVVVTYWTDPEADLPELDLQLRDIPDGTFDGTLVGSFGMLGDIEGAVLLSLDFDGRLEDDGAGGTRFEPGSTSIVGGATGPSGDTYAIDVTL